MNRTERAIKKQLRKLQNDKKREKNRALREHKDAYTFSTKERSSNELKKIVSEEKGLKKWHREIIADKQSKPYRNSVEEALTAF